MCDMRTFKAFTLCLLFAMTAMAGEPADQNRIIQEALKPSPLQNNLRRLTDEVGGRVPGTPAMQRAVDWGVAAFQAAGADTVHTEDFTIPQSWSEGATRFQVASDGGIAFDVRTISIAWAPPLAPVTHVPVVDVGDGSEAAFKRAGDISGKIVLVHSVVLKVWADLFAEYTNAPPEIDRAVKGHALAVAFIATREHDILYRHTNSGAGEIDRLPMVLVAREDGERISRLLASGKSLWAELSIPNHIGGPITAQNVVAELKGTDKPEEFVILGAHLDSWELGTGALDNGCNAALVVDALRAIKNTGLRPRRSLRFILFSGEEQGLIGSRAYATAHRNELDRAAGVVIYDAGTGRATGFSIGGRKDILDTAQKLVAPFEPFGATMLTTDIEWGTDHFDFLLEGVPTFSANQEEANYLENYHAVSDTYDKVDFAQLKNHVAEAAGLGFALADLPEKIGPRLSHDQITQTIRDSGSEEMFKSFGLWDEWMDGKRGRQK